MGLIVWLSAVVLLLSPLLVNNKPILQALLISAVVSMVPVSVVGEVLAQIAIMLGYNTWLFALIVVVVAVISTAAGYAYALIRANSGPGPFNPFS
jgi:hypothetical protein